MVKIVKIKNFFVFYALPTLYFKKISYFLDGGYYCLSNRSFLKTSRRTFFHVNKKKSTKFFQASFGSFAKVIIESNETLLFLFLRMHKSRFNQLVCHYNDLCLIYPFPNIRQISFSKKYIECSRVDGMFCYDIEWQRKISLFCRSKTNANHCFIKTNEKSLAYACGIKKYTCYIQHGDLHCENILKRSEDDYSFIDYDMIDYWPALYDCISILLSPRTIWDNMNNAFENITFLKDNIDFFVSELDDDCINKIDFLDKYISLFFLSRFDWLIKKARLSMQTSVMEYYYRIKPFIGRKELLGLPRTGFIITHLSEIIEANKKRILI